MTRKSVLFPEPFGPMTPTNSLFGNLGYDVLEHISSRIAGGDVFNDKHSSPSMKPFSCAVIPGRMARRALP